MSLDVSATAMASIRQSLTTGSQAIEAAGSSLPAAIDGGMASVDLAEMLADLMSSAGAVSQALQAGAGSVAEAAADYWAADDVVADAFGPAGLAGLIAAGARG